MVTTFYPPYNFGGDGIFVQRLARALAERGHLVSVIHCVDAYRVGGGKDPQDAPCEHPNIEVHALQSAAGALSPLITHQLATPGLKGATIEKILAEKDFDVIHFHNISLVGGPRILAYGEAVKLYTAHEYWLLCPLSTLWKYQREPCDGKSCISCTLHAGRPPQLWRYTGVLQRQLRHMDAILSPSQFLIRKHHEMGLDADFIHMPNFLPLEENDSGEHDATGITQRPFFLMVGRLEQSKGFQRAIEMFRDYGDADLVIVGTGQFEQELRALAEGYDHIHLTGRLDYEVLVSLYRAAVAVIVPSIWYEPFGLIVIEAFAQRTPVIVNEAGALPELIEQSQGGLVYRDNAGMRNAVATLLEKPQLRDELGEKGYRAYLEKWTEERYLAGYFELIENLAEKKRTSAQHS